MVPDPRQAKLPRRQRKAQSPARMAESVDALVSNTSGAIRAGSIPAPGTFWVASHWFSRICDFSFRFLHHICTTEILQIAEVLPDIACTFTGKLLSVPSFFWVSRAVSLCFCDWSIVTWKAPNECQDVWVWLHSCFHLTRSIGYRFLCGTLRNLYIPLRAYEVYTPEG